MNPDTRPDFPVGQCVKHVNYGIGKVVGESGRGEERRIDVDFERHGIKTFIAHLVGKNALKPEDA